MTVYRRLFTLHILRHGETGFNQLGIVQGAGVDAPLSNIGFIQAMGVGGVLKSLPGVLSSPWTVYCSTMKRTRESLSGFLLGFDMEDFDLGPEAALPSRNHPTSTAFTPTPPSFTDALREKAQGCREGKRNDMSQEEAERLDEAAGIDVASKFKESDKDVEVRVLDFHTNVLMVTHGGVIRVLLRDVFKVGGGPGQERIRVWNSSISKLDVWVATDTDAAGIQSDPNTCPAPPDPSAVNTTPNKGYKYYATLVGDIGDTSYIPPALVTKRSDW